MKRGTTMNEIGNRLLAAGLITEKELNHALDRQQKHGGRLGQNLVGLGYIKEEELEKFFKKNPPPPKTLEETCLSVSFIADLIMKHIIGMGEFMLADVAEAIKLPVFVVAEAIELLRRDKFVEVKGGTGYATVTYTFKASETGMRRGNDLMELCRYAGPAPVTLDAYNEMVRLQTVKSIVVSEEIVR